MAENLAAVAVEDLVPHRGDMSWLDTVLSADDETVVAQATVRPDSYFVRDGRAPVWVGVEYMAQAIAAWAGCRARRAGREPNIGFLLGSRRYTSTRDVFPSGTRLRIDARCELLADNGLGMFACSLQAGDEQWAMANVSVFEPADAMAYLESGEA